MSAPVVAAVALVAFGVFIALAYRQQWQWTGLPAPRGETEVGSGRSAKTLWDWLQLLGIPVALATLAFLLNDAQTQRDQKREDRRAAQQRTAAADAEREDTLRAYLAQMSELMLNDNLVKSRPEAAVRNVARTATLTAVRRLDGPRRGLVVRFLAEVGFTDFREADLRGANLRGANLRGAYFRDADLRGADLRGANLGAVKQGRAYFPGAYSRGADLGGANLAGATLAGATLSGANLSGAILSGANLSEADLRGAILRGAYLSGADLRGARDAELAGTRGFPAHVP